MEFTSKMTPKSLNPVHSAPHSSRGKSYLSHIRKNTDNSKLPYVTPPRKFSSQVPTYSRSQSKSVSASKLRFQPRTRNILQNSQTQNSSKENPKQSKWISKPNNDFETPPKPTKRPFKSLNSSLDTSDRYNVFSDDSDDDIFLSAKHEKILQKDLDKENNLKSPANRSSPKVYSSSGTKKKKIINLSKSNIFHDISPEKVSSSFESGNNIKKSETSKYFKFKSTIGKQNRTIETEDCKPTNFIEYPHMIGFPNFGNTCYLNAVMQTIISLQSFIIDLNNVLDMVNVSSSSLTKSLWNIIVARQKLDSFSVKKSLRTMKGNVEKIDDSFSGFKMQDANEFLTQVLDTVKDEIDKSSLHIHDDTTKITSTITPIKKMDKPTSIFDSPSSSSPLSLEVTIKENCEFVIDENDLVFLPPKQKETSERSSQPKAPNSLLLPTFQSLNGENNDYLINPVTNNFEFELYESFRCLGCGATEGRRQKHFALYVNLPSDGSENIQSSIQSYMSEDRRELTCAKCQHNTATFLTSFLQLPRVLIVQMKRYEYKPEQLECIKVSSKVNINVLLHLDSLISKDSSLPPTFSTKSLRDLRTTSALKEMDPSAVSNAKNESSADCDPVSSTMFACKPKCDSPSKEDKDLQEVLMRSLEDVGGADVNENTKSDPDKEEEEFQEAIRLSLQDTGMCYARKQPEEETDLQVQSPDDDENSGQHSYHLLSVISHFGQTTCTGHYVSDVLNIEENLWYHYDDESVTSVPESVVLSEGRQKNGYIFFYVHRDTYHELRRQKT